MIVVNCYGAVSSLESTTENEKVQSCLPAHCIGVYIITKIPNQGENILPRNPDAVTDRIICKKESPNFLARYQYGNPSKGIKNFHLNIRSLKTKMSEVKNIVKRENPHILGISEAELRKLNNFDQNSIKIPGYNVVLPKS